MNTPTVNRIKKSLLMCYNVTIPIRKGVTLMTAKLQFKIRCKAKDLKVEIAKAYAKLPK